MKAKVRALIDIYEIEAASARRASQEAEDTAVSLAELTREAIYERVAKDLKKLMQETEQAPSCP